MTGRGPVALSGAGAVLYEADEKQSGGASDDDDFPPTRRSIVMSGIEGPRLAYGPDRVWRESDEMAGVCGTSRGR